MSDVSSYIEQLSPLKQALLALERLQAKLDTLEQAKHEPIAIIGLGCRFPGGASNAEDFWQMLCDEVDAITEIPADRWDREAFYDANPHEPGKMHTRYGGFLPEVDKFDPSFFGISPREAIHMDPQQRLLLEVAWEALEDAGQVNEQLVGSKTGVFIGMMSKDYAKFAERSDNLSLIDAYYCTGNDFSFAPGRLSYVFGLHGPSVALDTACSSSLVAVHLACQSLRNGECEMALAGGVSLMLSPELNIFLSKAGAMAPDGRCKTFDASANGMGRGEGCGVVILKRLSAARRDGDRVLALIRGSAMNHDGPSGGLTVPNGLAQQQLLRQALTNAGVEPAQVDYVEAHGTGTILGDPIELHALNEIYSKGRTPDHPLIVSSVKTNIGHLDPAAGIAGLIKTVLMLQKRAVPRHLHLRELNPRVSWSDMLLEVPTQYRSWEAKDGVRRAGVSSFGLSGVNAHIVLQEAVRPSTDLQGEGESREHAYLLTLSAHNKETLSALAHTYTKFLTSSAGEQELLADICYTASVRRSHHDYRIAVAGRSHAELATGLEAFLQGDTLRSLVHGQKYPGQKLRLIFVFPGQGAQWFGMGRQLLKQESIFRQVLERCDECLRLYTGWSLLDELLADEQASRLDQTQVAQPLLFAIEIALAELWRSWGIVPDAVVGHSLGELAAAYVAGILSLEDAIRIVFHRSRLMQQVTGYGKMVLVHLPHIQVERLLNEYPGDLSIGAINSPTTTVLSGAIEAMDTMLQILQERGVAYQPLRVNYAFHSSQMEPFRNELVDALQGLSLHPGSIPVISTVTGQVHPWNEFDAAYWARNMRETVRFATAIGTALEAAADDDYSAFLELSPHPVLSMDITACIQKEHAIGSVLPCMRRNQDERVELLSSLGALYCLGYPAQWLSLFPSPRRCIALPQYPWQRERYWITDHGYVSRPTLTVQKQQVTVEQVPTHAMASPEDHIVAREQLLQAPREEQQRLLRDYVRSQVARVLRLAKDKVDERRSLQKMGMDSLTAVELKNRIELDLGVVISLVHLLQGPSVTQLSDHISEQLLEAASSVSSEENPFALPELSALAAQELHLPAITPLKRDKHTPLSFAQQRLWFLDQLATHRAAYNEFIALRLQGNLNRAALEQSLGEIIRRHEVLRTNIVTVGEEAVQVIAPVQPFRLQQIDLQDYPLSEREERAVELTRMEVQRLFSLEHDSLLRMQLYCLDSQDHILCVVFHHIICDGWSVEVFFKELAVLYAAFLQGEPSPLPDLPIQYADYVIWQRRLFQEAVFSSQLDYWKHKLGGGVPISELPTDHPRPAVLKYSGARYYFHLSQTLTAALKELSRDENVTLFMTLLAAFQTLLYRYSGQDDVVVGSPISNRNRAETELLIGFMVNMLVLRTDLAGNPSFRDLLARVRQVALEAYTHQHVPFEKLVEELQPERQLNRYPLVQVAFVLQGAMTAEVQLQGLSISTMDLQNNVTRSDLELQMWEVEEALKGQVTYSTELFEPSTIERMMAHFTTLLECIVENRALRIDAIPLLTEAEMQQMLLERNTCGAAQTDGLCVHQEIARYAASTPDAVALVCRDMAITYQELNQRANQVAHFLGSCGVGADVLVGVCMERSLEMLVCMLGILKSGGAYVPLNPAYPQERLQFLIQDSQLQVILTQERLQGRLSTESRQLVCLDRDWGMLSQEAVSDPLVEVSPNQLAYVIYTSGSTGTPKGCMVTHRGVLNLVQALAATYEVTASSRVLQFVSPSFDASVGDIFPSLCTGATLELVPEESMSQQEEIATLLWNHAITQARIPHTMLAALDTQDLPCLQTIATGGEALSAKLVSRWSMGRRFYNEYGPTETSVSASVSHCLPDGKPPTIGHPLTNVSIYLLDADLHPVPVGVRGELYIGGVGVGRGYWGRPDLTAERFVPDPYSQEAGARFYKTGDQGRYLSDGSIEFLGRLDQQVKLRGYRIEVGEIEEMLNLHPEVQAAAVVLREDEVRGQFLVAYVVSNQMHPTSSSALRDFLHDRLPEYMVPSNFVQLDHLPMAGNGKIDRKALQSAPMKDFEESHTVTMPRGPIEEMLVAIWTQLLGIKRISVYDNFFSLGGHSLLATQFISRVRTQLHVELPLRSVWEEGTIASLASRVEEQLRGDDQGRTLAMVPLRRDHLPRLSFAQQRLWFLEQLEAGNPLYNMTGALRLQGPLVVQVLEQCLQELVQRQESLRTTFGMELGHPVQIIAPALISSLPIYDISRLPEGVRDEKVVVVANTEASRLFDLAQGPLFRWMLVRLDQNDHLLLVTMHHIITDGWSMNTLIKELMELYGALISGQTSPLHPLPLQYADFAHWQREEWSEERLEEQLVYWRNQLGGELPTIELPTDHPRPAVQSYRGARKHIFLPESLTEELRALSQQEGVTLFMLLLAAFQTLLYRYSGQEDILVGTPVAGRNRSEIEHIIGFFVNTLVIHTHLTDHLSFRELLQQVREAALGAYAHQDLPFEKLVEVLQPTRDMSRSPLFQVMFSMQDVSHIDYTSAGLTLHPQDAGYNGTAKFDLALLVRDVGQTLRVDVEYCVDLFEAATVSRWLEHWQQLLMGIVASPAQCLCDLPLLSEAEQQLIVEWNATSLDYSPWECVHRSFERQVEQAPDAVALVFEGAEVTYHVLNQRANQLASYLRTLGVGPDMLVGIFVERSLEMVVGLLAVLKAGGAYVPLDPRYPKERLAFMVADTQLSVLLTQQHLLPDLPEHRARVVCLDEDWPSIALQSKENPGVAVQGDNLAYVIYTSGSTGKPKGVQIVHRALTNFLYSMRQQPALTEQDRLLAVTTLSFDIAGLELFLPLIAGAQIVLVSREVAANGFQLLEQVGIWEATVMQATPATWRLLLEAEWQGSQHLKILCGGEALPRSLAVQLCERSRELWNMYGPTETTIWSAIQRLDVTNEIISIGHPIANTHIYLLDRSLHLVPIGVHGELYIGGTGLARGYLNRGDLTAEKFVPNPFSQEPGARLYRTGDLARYRPDGTIEFLGRIDHQVKVRGFRIELGEIEMALDQHPAVQTCTVLLREDHAGDKRLVAYIVKTQEEHITSGELRHYLQGKLPEYMIPSFFVFLDDLPSTPAGKLDRRALPQPQSTRERQSENIIPPRNPVEEILVELWSEVLGVDYVGIHDNFFELGGHSLMATQLVSRIKTVLQINLPVRSLFEAPTIEQLGEKIAAAMGSASLVEEQPIVAIARDREFPPSFAQERLWFLNQLAPESSSYNLLLPLQLGGVLHLEILEDCLREIIRRHEALRTIFPVSDGMAVQRVLPAFGISLPVFDINGLTESRQEEEVSRIGTGEAKRIFHLATGPLVRGLLLRLHENRHVLLMTIHHTIFDAWSARVFMRELSALYEAFLAGTSSPLQELPVQYIDFSMWQREKLRGEVVANEVGYWRTQLDGARALVFPDDPPHPVGSGFHGAVMPFKLSAELTKGLLALSREEGVTLFMTLLTAFQILLYRYTDQQDIVVGTDIANRTRTETEKLIGFFINLLVLRTQIDEQMQFREVLQRVRETVLGAYSHQELPFEKLVDALQLERKPQQVPLVRALFVLQNVPISSHTIQSANLTLSQVDIKRDTANFEFALFMREEPEGLIGVVNYSSALFTSATIEKLLSWFQELLKSIVASPEAKVGSLEMHTEKEKQHQLVQEALRRNVNSSRIKSAKRASVDL